MPTASGARLPSEAETARWSALPGVADVPAPEARFYEAATAQELDARLRHLADLRAGWEDLVGYCALAVRRSRMYRLLGFESFRQVLRRAARPTRARHRAARRPRGATLGQSPALQEAKRQGLPFEKLRLLSRLPEDEIGRWTARAQVLTCVALRRKLEGEAERQMRAQRKLTVPLPLRVAAVLAAAIHAVRERAGKLLPLGDMPRRRGAALPRHVAREREAGAQPLAEGPRS